MSIPADLTWKSVRSSSAIERILRRRRPSTPARDLAVEPDDEVLADGEVAEQAGGPVGRDEARRAPAAGADRIAASADSYLPVHAAQPGRMRARSRAPPSPRRRSAPSPCPSARRSRARGTPARGRSRRRARAGSPPDLRRPARAESPAGGVPRPRTSVSAMFSAVLARRPRAPARSAPSRITATRSELRGELGEPVGDQHHDAARRRRAGGSAGRTRPTRPASAPSSARRTASPGRRGRARARSRCAAGSRGRARRAAGRADRAMPSSANSRRVLVGRCCGQRQPVSSWPARMFSADGQVREELRLLVDDRHTVRAELARPRLARRRGSRPRRARPRRRGS